MESPTLNVLDLIVQGGALGLLAIVIFLIWKYISKRIEIDNERMAKQEARLDKTMEFMRNFAQQITEQQSAQVQTWQELSGNTIKSLERVHGRLDRVDEGLVLVSDKLDEIIKGHE